MKRFFWAPAVSLICLAAAMTPFRADVTAASGDPHAYFNALVQRAEHFRSYSLRDAAQLDLYRATKARQQWVTYDTTVDAARIEIPEFDPVAFGTVATALTSSSTSLQISVTGYPQAQWNSIVSGTMTNGRALKIDNEVVYVQRQSGVSLVDATIQILRGQQGTAAVAHAGGAGILVGANSLLNIVKLPLGTADGHNYLFTWDASWTPSYLFANHGIVNHKTWQFSNNNGLWFQVDTRLNGRSGNNAVTPDFDANVDIGAVGARSAEPLGGAADWMLNTTNKNGPNVLTNGQLSPQLDTFVVKPNTWVRYWVLIEQRANNYDLMSMWAADRDRGPVKVFERLQLSVRPTGTVPNSIDAFWLEYNTSENVVKQGRGSLISFARNFVALQDVANPEALMLRPDSSEPIPSSSTAAPAPPTNVRIVN